MKIRGEKLTKKEGEILEGILRLFNLIKYSYKCEKEVRKNGNEKNQIQIYKEGEGMKIVIQDKLRVGAHIYTVEIRNDYRVMEGCVGATSKPALKMIIDRTDGTPQSIVDERFVHELLHTVFVEAGFYQNATVEFTITEEQLIERITPVLHQILVDNKIQGDIEPLHLSSPYVF